MKYFESIKELRELNNFFRNFKYKGVEFWSVMAPSFFGMFENKSTVSARKHDKIKKILGYLFLLEKYNFDNFNKNSILASCFSYKPQYRSFFEESIKNFSRDEMSILMPLRKNNRKKMFISFPNLFSFFSVYKKLNNLQIRKIFKGYLSFIELVSEIHFNKRRVERLEKIVNKNNFSAYISFNSVAEKNEVILTQLMKNKGKKTFNLQHGILFDYDKFYPSCILFDNMISDYWMLWGEKSFSVTVKHLDKKKLIVVGNPNYSKIKKRNFGKLKRGLFFLNHSDFEKSNFELIRLINKFSNNFDGEILIKLHPSEKNEKYKKLLNGKGIKMLEPLDSTSEAIVSTDFVVLHNTSVMLDTLKEEVPRFRFKDKFTQDLSGPNDFFSNEKELSNLVKKYSKKENYKKLMKEYKKEFENNFYQPKGMTISEYYKKKIMEKIKK